MIAIRDILAAMDGSTWVSECSLLKLARQLVPPERAIRALNSYYKKKVPAAYTTNDRVVRGQAVVLKHALNDMVRRAVIEKKVENEIAYFRIVRDERQ